MTVNSMDIDDTDRQRMDKPPEIIQQHTTKLESRILSEKSGSKMVQKW